MLMKYSSVLPFSRETIAEWSHLWWCTIWHWPRSDCSFVCQNCLHFLMSCLPAFVATATPCSMRHKDTSCRLARGFFLRQRKTMFIIFEHSSQPLCLALHLKPWWYDATGLGFFAHITQLKLNNAHFISKHREHSYSGAADTQFAFNLDASQTIWLFVRFIKIIRVYAVASVIHLWLNERMQPAGLTLKPETMNARSLLSVNIFFSHHSTELMLRV